MNVQRVFVLLFVVTSGCISAIKVVMMPQFAPSHCMVMAKLGDELASRGHEVSILIGDDVKYAIGKPNFIIFELSTEFKEYRSLFLSQMSTFGDKGLLGIFRHLFNQQQQYCDLFFRSQKMIDEVRSADILIGDALYLCSTLVADKYDIPHVVVNMVSITSPTLPVFGILSNPSYTPQISSAISTKMGFVDRIKNLGFYIVNIWITEVFIYPTYRKIKVEHDVKPQKSIRETMATVDMVLLEKDLALDHAHPVPPNVREVGSFLPAPAQPLPAEFEEFMQGSGDDGVILVSFGSLVNDLHDDVIGVMNEAFSMVPQKVMWKIKLGSFKGKIASNVRIFKWLPQNDILGHRKTKLFITHAGANGVAEASFHGVSMICSPFFGDQHGTSQFLKDSGYGEILNVVGATTEQLVNLMHKVIHDESYKEKLSHISRVMKMRPRTPVNEAADLIEYVQAVGNVDHLKPKGQSLPFCQLYMLDVLLVFLIAFYVAFKIFFAFVKLSLGLCFGSSKQTKTS